MCSHISDTFNTAQDSLPDPRCIGILLQIHVTYLLKAASLNNNRQANDDRLSRLVVRVPGYGSLGPGSTPSSARFSETYWVWNRVHSASWVHSSSSFEEQVGACLENRYYCRRGSAPLSVWLAVKIQFLTFARSSERERNSMS
jgi:hypothetical protein